VRSCNIVFIANHVFPISLYYYYFFFLEYEVLFFFSNHFCIIPFIVSIVNKKPSAMLSSTCSKNSFDTVSKSYIILYKNAIYSGRET